MGKKRKKKSLKQLTIKELCCGTENRLDELGLADAVTENKVLKSKLLQLDRQNGKMQERITKQNTEITMLKLSLDAEKLNGRKLTDHIRDKGTANQNLVLEVEKANSKSRDLEDKIVLLKSKIKKP